MGLYGYRKKNNASVKVDYVRIDVAYYKAGKLVGVGTSTSTSFGAGETTTMKALQPTDRNSHALEYDDYKLYVAAYNYNY